VNRLSKLKPQKYYNDGYQFAKIADANQLKDVDSLEVGQVLNIPKSDGQVAAAEVTPSPTEQATPAVSATPAPTKVAQATPAPTENPAVTSIDMSKPNPNAGQGGPENVTAWGDKISGTTYTVQQGDWLSKIAGRAYGDIMQYQKIAAANHITNPNVIEPGTVLQIPR
jgi:nucleoid-associated protein YgaU